MTGPEYATALTTLSLTPDQAAIWLGIGRSTAYRYLKTGCEGAVERALETMIALRNATLTLEMVVFIHGEFKGGSAESLLDAQELVSALHVRHSDLTVAVGLPVNTKERGE